MMAGREAEPSACGIYSQSVKTTERGGVQIVFQKQFLGYTLPSLSSCVRLITIP